MRKIPNNFNFTSYETGNTSDQGSRTNDIKAQKIKN